LAEQAVAHLFIVCTGERNDSPPALVHLSSRHRYRGMAPCTIGAPVAVGIAHRLGKSAAQVVLRRHLQRGNVVIPKSATLPRITENFELLDVRLEHGDVVKIDALDRGETGRTGVPTRSRRSRRTHICSLSARANAATHRIASRTAREGGGQQWSV
jgi:hypothetical protein